MGTSSTKLKIIYGTEEATDGSKTINNMNPEATNESLIATANAFVALQNKVMKSVERIDTTTITG